MIGLLNLDLASKESKIDLEMGALVDRVAILLDSNNIRGCTLVSACKMSSLSAAAGSPTYSTLSSRPGLITAGSTAQSNQLLSLQLSFK